MRKVSRNRATWRKAGKTVGYVGRHGQAEMVRAGEGIGSWLGWTFGWPEVGLDAEVDIFVSLIICASGPVMAIG